MQNNDGMQADLLRRTTPFSRAFGGDRGQPIDRYYIENFLRRFSDDIRGHVLEIGDAGYTHELGGDRVIASDVLDVREDNPQATIIAELGNADVVRSDTFDCIILTQTLQFIYDIKPAIRTLHRILKPGGIVLVTVPGISQISRFDMDHEGDYWRFTTLSMRRLFAESFAHSDIAVEAYGNVLTAIAFLHGLAVQELSRDELDLRDPDYELLITLKAVKR